MLLFHSEDAHEFVDDSVEFPEEFVVTLRRGNFYDDKCDGVDSSENSKKVLDVICVLEPSDDGLRVHVFLLWLVFNG